MTFCVILMPDTICEPVSPVALLQEALAPKTAAVFCLQLQLTDVIGLMSELFNLNVCVLG